jgi:hypothetical protein
MRIFGRLLGLMATTGALCAAAACSSDDGSSDGAGGSGGAGGGAGAASGGGGGGGAAGAGGSGGVATGGGGTGGSSTMACDTTPCEGYTVMGIDLPTCCITDTQCGVGGDPCGPVEAIQQYTGDASLPDFPAETIYPDSACPPLSVNLGAAITFRGCCDQTGVCGVALEELEQQFGIPDTCLTTAEASELAPTLGLEAGTDPPCDYPGDAGSTADGG